MNIERILSLLSTQKQETGETERLLQLTQKIIEYDQREVNFEIIKRFEHSAIVQTALLKELTRLQNVPKESQEYANIVEYIRYLDLIPNGEGILSYSLEKISEALNENHYGLTDVKEIIMEYFALEKHLGKSQGMNLLFTGSPGTGKTTLAMSIAKAVNREFISISLAGMNDESEIRGHRRTYLGSKPGRIGLAFLNAKTTNPLILLDEIDKVSSSRVGDPSSALLELLDPIQNGQFIDRYLEIPLDLSKVLFICTSNNDSSLSSPLKDRLEIIKFRDYTLDEKEHIIRDHMIPSISSKYQMHISICPNVVSNIITNNLREIKRRLERLHRYCFRNEIQALELKTYNLLYPTSTKKRRVGFDC